MDTEHRVLSEVTPLITAANPRLRAPRVIAHYPERSVLVLEFVPGVTLSTMLFSARPPRTTISVTQALGLAAEWLARLHRLTETAVAGGAFASLAETFAKPTIARLVETHIGPETYDEIVRLLGRFAARYRDDHDSRCVLHGEYAPYHLIVGEEDVSVIDLASSRTGYRYEDLAFFLASYDALFPWRGFLGGLRLPAAEQQRLFMDAYAAASDGLTEPTRVATAFGRIVAFARFASRTAGRDTWKRRILSYGTRSWVRRAFRRVCREQLALLHAIDRGGNRDVRAAGSLT
jgi:aminoglycoside phosphotransferase (APT) family kinase protein